MTPPAPKRRKYQDTSPVRRLSREREAQEFLAMLEATVSEAQNEARRSRTKRLFLIQGDAGVGKSWFLDYLAEIIQRKYPAWPVVTRYEAQNFIEKIEKTPYYNFLAVLHGCDRALHIHSLGELNEPPEPTIEQVAEWAGQLEEQLNKDRAGPLLLFFDDLEWWVGVDEVQRATLNQFLRIVWQMLLRKAHIPCIIVCATRHPPAFNNPLLRLALATYELKGFAASELEKLIEHHADVTSLRPFIDRNALGNPWITQLLDINLPLDPAAFQQEPQKEAIRRRLFAAVVSDRLQPDLSEVLYKLAKQRPDGFQPEDDLLPEGHTTLNNLIASSFAKYNHETRRYVVTSVLTSLFKE